MLVPQSAAGAIPDPTEDDLKRYYENHRAKFTQPEFRKIGVLAVTPETVKDQVKITEADLKAAYDADKDTLGKPEKRLVQQITFPDLDAAKAAREKINAGTDFLEVAKAQGLSEADINLGNVTRAELADPVIAEEVFKLEKDKVSEPVTGKLGNVVLLRVTAIEPGKSLTFEEAKAELEKKILKERASGAIFDLHDKVEDELASGAQLSEIADKFKLTYQVIDQVDREGKRPDGSTVTLPAQKEVLNAAFATDAGVENDAIDAKDEGVIWYEVLGVTPEQLKPFEEVKADVEKGWRSEESRNRMRQICAGPDTSLNSGKTLEDIAKDLNVEVLTSDALKRDGLTANILPATVARAFTLPRRRYGSAPSAIDEGRVVFKVDKVTAPPPLDERTSERLKQQLALLIERGCHLRIFRRAREPLWGEGKPGGLAKLTGTGEEP